MPTPTGYSAVNYSSFSGDISDALISGVQWASLSVTYSFPNYQSLWSTNATSGYGSVGGNGEPWSIYYSPLVRSDKNAVDAGMKSFSNVSQLELVRVEETSSNVGDIRLAYTDTSGAQAWAYSPSESAIGGDIWFNTLGTSYLYKWKKGSYEFLTAIHEIGHALGLKHPFSTSSYNNLIIDPSLDSRSFTIMSYSAAPGDTETYFSFEPTTPMVLDVAALQDLYGANNSYKDTDTVYVFRSDKNYHKTLWDAGGIDEIVYDSMKNGIINLADGIEGGSRLGKKLSIYDYDGGLVEKGVFNIWIAEGVVIENAKGGSGNDTILGNSANNRLIGREGNDFLDGLSGDDILTGNLGDDALYGQAGIDQLRGGKGNDTMSGGDDDDFMKGGGGGDTLIGGDGNDILIGGGGKDIFIFDSNPDAALNIDILQDFSSGEDLLVFDLNVFDVLSFDANGILSLDQFLVGNNTVAPQTTEHHLIYDSFSGDLYYDSDGIDVIADTVKIATMTNLSELDISDISYVT